MFDILPKNVIFEISIRLPLGDVKNLCLIGRRYAKICGAREFWNCYMKVKREFPR